MRRLFSQVPRSFNGFPHGSPVSQGRGLHSWTSVPAPPKREFVFGGVGARLGTFSSLSTHPAAAHKEVILVREPQRWLDSLHPRFNSIRMGQLYGDLPQIVQELLKKNKLYVSSDTYIDARRFALIDKLITQELTKLPNVKVITGTVTEVAANYIDMFHGDQRFRISFHEKTTHIYDYARKPVSVSLPVLDDGQLTVINTKAHDCLYSRAANEYGKTTVLMGTSVSSIWAHRDFGIPGSTQIVCIGRHKSMWTNVPANADVDNIDGSTIPRMMSPPTAESLQLSAEEFNTYQLKKIDKILGREPTDKKEQERLYIEACGQEGYAMFKRNDDGRITLSGRLLPMGKTDIQPDFSYGVFDDLDEESILSAAGMQYTGLTKKLRMQHPQMVTTVTQNKVAARPKNMPEGSFVYMAWRMLEDTNNRPITIAGDKPYFYGEKYEKALIQFAQTKGVYLAHEMFVEVAEQVRALHFAPTPAKIDAIWKEAYINCLSQKDGNYLDHEAEWGKINKIFGEFLAQESANSFAQRKQDYQAAIRSSDDESTPTTKPSQ